jgi:hypothetical protein
VSPLRYELDFDIPEDDILYSHCRENLKSYMLQTRYSIDLQPVVRVPPEVRGCILRKVHENILRGM